MHTRSLCTLISAAVVVCCRSLSLTQYAVWSCLQPHLSPSGDSWGYDSPKRSTFLADLHTWYSGGRGPLAGTLSCRWLLADRPCSPMLHPPLYRSGTCTHHSVPKPGNFVRHVPRCCTQLAEWTIWPKALLILFCVVAVELFLPLSLELLLRHTNDNIAECSKSNAAVNGAMVRLGTVAACCYFSDSSFRQSLASIQLFSLRLLPALLGWWGVSTTECWWRGQLTVRCDVQRGFSQVSGCQMS